MAALTYLLIGLCASSIVEAGLAGLFQIPETYASITACLNQPSFYSCENTTAIKDTCCSPTPGGLGMFYLVIQTVLSCLILIF